MENNLKLNFENYLNEKNLTNSQKKIKESNFEFEGLKIVFEIFFANCLSFSFS